MCFYFVFVFCCLFHVFAFSFFDFLGSVVLFGISYLQPNMDGGVTGVERLIFGRFLTGEKQVETVGLGQHSG